MGVASRSCLQHSVILAVLDSTSGFRSLPLGSGSFSDYFLLF